MRWVDLSRHNLAVWALRPRGLVVLPILEAHAMPGIDASTMGSLRAAGARVELNEYGTLAGAEFRFEGEHRVPGPGWWLRTFEAATMRDTEGLPDGAPWIEARARSSWQWLWRFQNEGTREIGYALTEEEAARAGGVSSSTVQIDSKTHTEVLRAGILRKPLRGVKPLRGAEPLGPVDAEAAETEVENTEAPSEDVESDAIGIRKDYGKKIGGARKDGYTHWELSPSQKEALTEVLAVIDRDSLLPKQAMIRKARGIARAYRCDSIWPMDTPGEMVGAWRAWEADPGIAKRPDASIVQYVFLQRLRALLPSSTTLLESGRSRRRSRQVPAVGWILLGAGYGAIIEGVRDFAQRAGSGTPEQIRDSIRRVASAPDHPDLPEFHWYANSPTIDKIHKQCGTPSGGGDPSGLRANWLGHFHDAVRTAAAESPLSACGMMDARAIEQDRYATQLIDAMEAAGRIDGCESERFTPIEYDLA